jgi:hypothetical protein
MRLRHRLFVQATGNEETETQAKNSKDKDNTTKKKKKKKNKDTKVAAAKKADDDFFDSRGKKRGRAYNRVISVCVWTDAGGLCVIHVRCLSLLFCCASQVARRTTVFQFTPLKSSRLDLEEAHHCVRLVSMRFSGVCCAF